MVSKVANKKMYTVSKFSFWTFNKAEEDVVQLFLKATNCGTSM